jgi:hypothetical protein
MDSIARVVYCISASSVSSATVTRLRISFKTILGNGRLLVYGFAFAVLFFLSIGSLANAGTIAVSIADHNAFTNQWSNQEYPRLQSCLAQGLAVYGAFYKRQFRILPVGQTARAGIHIDLTGAPNCSGYPGVNNGTRQACVSVNWCIQNRPSDPMLCVEECVIHEAAESLGKQVYDAAQGHTEVVNGCALPDFIIPAKVQKQTGFRDADDQMPR